MQNTTFRSRQDFYRQMELTSINDDPIGVLSNIYDDEYPHPVFDPKKICFRRYRNYNHLKYNDRKSIKENVRTVFEDFEMYLPGVGDEWHGLLGTFDPEVNPLREHDFVITSCVTKNDHLWPVPYVYNNYHFVKTHLINRGKKIARPTDRPFFADVLLGTNKPHRELFFQLMQQNNMLETNIINFFGTYKSKFLNSVNDPQQLVIDRIQTENNNSTTELLNGHFTSQHISGHIMENSWYSVVAESIFKNDCFFVTEKTAKPMMAGRPFIILGGKHYLKNLRGLGFKTFDPVIDESYDNIDGLQERVKRAFASFQSLITQDPVKVYSKLKDVIEHNQRIMYDRKKLTQRATRFLDSLHIKYAYTP